MDTNTTSSSSGASQYLTPVAVLLGAIIIAGAFYFGNGTAPTAATQNTGDTQAAAVVNIKDVKTSGEPFIGDKNAPVTMAIWYDYQCPFCKLLDKNSMPQLYSDYVKTGKLRIVFKDFAFLGPDSYVDGLFSRAVWDLYPNKFYTWFQAMYKAQDGENTGFGDLKSVEKLAKTIPGLDVSKIVANMNSKNTEYKAVMSADRAEGNKMGVRGTPSMIIGKQLLVGAQPYDVIKAAIDAELKNSKK